MLDKLCLDVRKEIRKIKEKVAEEDTENFIDSLIKDKSVVKRVKKGSQTNPMGYIYLPKDYIDKDVRVSVVEK